MRLRQCRSARRRAGCASSMIFLTQSSKDNIIRRLCLAPGRSTVRSSRGSAERSPAPSHRRSSAARSIGMRSRDAALSIARRRATQRGARVWRSKCSGIALLACQRCLDAGRVPGRVERRARTCGQRARDCTRRTTTWIGCWRSKCDGRRGTGRGRGAARAADGADARTMRARRRAARRESRGAVRGARRLAQGRGRR